MAQAPRSGIEATAIELREFSFKLNATAARSDSGGLIPPDYGWEASSALDEANQLLHVTAELNTLPRDDGATAAFDLRAVLVVEFTWGEETSIDIEKFAQHNGVAFAWPYLRELVWNFTVRGGLPALLVPLLNFAAEGSVTVTRADLVPL